MPHAFADFAHFFGPRFIFRMLCILRQRLCAVADEPDPGLRPGGSRGNPASRRLRDAAAGEMPAGTTILQATA